jgi:hypothetical protein
MRKRFSFSSFVLVLIFVIIFVFIIIIIIIIIIISKSSFFYIIYAKDGRKKTYLFDRSFFIPMNFIGT